MNHADILIRQLEAVRHQIDAALALLRGVAELQPTPAHAPVQAPALFVAEGDYHTDGFELVRHRGTDYRFSPKQRRIVARLWDAQRCGRPVVHQQALLDAADSDCDSLSELFKRHPAYGTLIVRVAPGLYRLDLDGQAAAGAA